MGTGLSICRSIIELRVRIVASGIPCRCPHLLSFLTKLAEEKTGLLKSEFQSIGNHSLGVPVLVALSAAYYLIEVSF
jgi:hypothetical protein